MKAAIKKGFSFGLTSGVITTLGLIIGLAYSTQSRLAVIGGILTIAVADSLSDALGIHISEEADKETSNKKIWASTIATGIYKFIIALTFLIPVMLLKGDLAIIASIIWGFFLLGYITLSISKDRGTSPIRPLIEHYTIAIIVIVTTFYLGKLIHEYLPLIINVF